MNPSSRSFTELPQSVIGRVFTFLGLLVLALCSAVAFVVGVMCILALVLVVAPYYGLMDLFGLSDQTRSSRLTIIWL